MDLNTKKLKAKELAKELNVSPRWIQYQYSRGKIPAEFHCGRMIRFDLDRVIKALQPDQENPSQKP